MKKRLLSAALALAMVLTLLPMSAFAATTYTAVDASSATSVTPDASNPVGKSFTYQASTDYSSCAPVTLQEGEWYWKAPADTAGNIKVYKADRGFILGTSTSGIWYPDGTTYEAKNPNATTAPGSLTLLGTAPAFTKPWPTSLTVDVNGKTFSLSSLNNCGTDGKQAMTQITVTDRRYVPGGSRTSVTIPASDRSAYVSTQASAVTINATNVNVNAINLKGYGNTVTLNNCEATSITLDGTTVNSAGATSYTAQRLTTSNDTSITGTIAITGNGSTVSLQDTVGGGAVNMTSDAGSVTIGGNSTIGKVTVQNQTAGTGAIPTVTVNGGTVAGIDNTGSNTTASSTITINRTSSNLNISGEIKTNKGTVAVTNANTSAITVGSGSLTIAGSGVNVGGNITLGDQGATTLSITATSSKFAGFKTTTGSNLTISSWPTGRGNYYGDLDLTGYAGKGIKGGTFSASAASKLGEAKNMNWVDNANLQFIVPIKTNSPAAGAVALYGKDELTEAISSIAATTAATEADCITVLGQASGTYYIQLNFGGNPWAFIKYNATTGIALPTRINNTPISKWIVDNGTTGISTGTSFAAGTTEAIPAIGRNLVLDSTDTGAGVTSVSKVVGVSNGTVDNANVRVRLENNTIVLSGAVITEAGGYASIKVDLTTDAIAANGEPVVLKGVVIDWNSNTGKAAFNAINPSLDAYGAIVRDGALVLNRGTGASYTVSANLAVSASTLGLADPEIKAAVGGSISSWSAIAKQTLIDDIEKDGSFDINGNRAMLEAINAAQATITSDTNVTNWIASARDYIWKNGSPDATLGLGKHTGNWKDFANVASAATDYGKVRDNYNKAYIVPYLLVTVTNYNEQLGTLTATLTPYYRVDVSAEPYNADAAYTVQAGRVLSDLTGDMSSQPVKVNLGLSSTNFNNAYAHQDDTYVYQASTQEYSIYHAGKTGLGTIEINQKDGLISIESNIKDRNPAVPDYKYNSLQAAVDDTMPGVTQANTQDGSQVDGTMDTIIVDGNYEGSCDFTMTGYARKIKVEALGDLPIKCTSQNVDVQNPSGYTYYFQLKKDTAPVGGNITIASATGGTASVSANPAAVGSTVTVTLTASTGYTPSGVTVRTSSGTNVSVSGSGSTYTFTMPSGAVTVTPSFTQTQTVTNATVSVSNPNRGSGTAVTSVGSNKVAPGTTVTVSTTPSNGQRTMGLSVTGATAYRTGENQFTFTVPSGYSNVVVTPTFDAQNGTSFSDVWSTEYFSPAVAWAVGRGITNGTSTYTFGSYNTCTREDMVTFLYRAAGSPAVGNVSNPFRDVQPGSYYYNAVMWAVSKGITNGVSATQFGVGQTVTRAQAVTFLYRYNGSPAASTNSGFYDVPSSEYYAKAVSWANATGVTNGTSTTAFSPNQNCQRAQIVTFLYRNANGIRA